MLDKKEFLAQTRGSVWIVVYVSYLLDGEVKEESHQCKVIFPYLNGVQVDVNGDEFVCPYKDITRVEEITDRNFLMLRKLEEGTI